MEILKCTNVAIAYDKSIIAKNISFSLERGQYMCVVGENGTGKSSLLKVILGLLPAYEGNIEFAPNFKRCDIGYLPQQSDFQKSFPASVFEIVLSGRLNSMQGRPFYAKNDRTTALHNMKLLGIESLKNRCYYELSGGQQQRVLLARALCSTAIGGMLLLDEPMTGLDPIATADMHLLISDINKSAGTTIIMVSHDIHTAVKHATHILHMGSTMQFFGTTEEYEKSDIGKRFLCAWGGKHNEHN